MYSEIMKFALLVHTLALRPSSLRYVLSKVHSWAIHLSRFAFFINHIGGADNVSVDILTRWSKGYRSISDSTGSIAALHHDVISASISISTLSVEDVKQEQGKYVMPEVVTVDDEGVLRHNNKIWNSNEAKNLKLRIIVQAHSEEEVHRA